MLDELMSLARHFDCLAEMAILAKVSGLPIFGSGGKQELLIWDNKWNENTKYQVHQRQLALKCNCLDDIEFGLKLYTAWLHPPWLPSQRNESQRSLWAGRWVINYLPLEQAKIFSESIDCRPVDFTKLDTIRILLAYILEIPRSKYQYSSESHQGIALDVWIKKLNRIGKSKRKLERLINDWNTIHNNQLWESQTLSRLFIEQFYPPGAIYICRPNGSYNGGASLDPQQLLKPPVFANIAHTLPHNWHFSSWTKDQLDPSWRYRLEVTDHRLSADGWPEVIFSHRRIIASEQFAEQYRIGDIITVKPVSVYQYPDGTYRQIAEEVKTKATVIVSAHVEPTTVRVTDINTLAGYVLAGSAQPR